MQTIFQTSLTPEQYAENNFEEQVRPPLQCPACKHAHTLEALGYYSRFVTRAIATVLQIWVRRFLCRDCRISVSCLPQFAQPYRVVNSPTIEAAFNGEESRAEVQRWMLVVRTYWRSFEAHLPELVRRVGQEFGAVPVNATAREFWERCVQGAQGLEQTTRELIARFRTCLFGTYRCHQPEKQARKSRGK
jgi:hypothetical protein